MFLIISFSWFFFPFNQQIWTHLHCFTRLFKTYSGDSSLLLRKINKTLIFIEDLRTWVFYVLSNSSMQTKKLKYRNERFSPSYPPVTYYEDISASKLFFFYSKDKPILDLFSFEFDSLIEGSNPNILICTVYKSEVFYLKAKEGGRKIFLVYSILYFIVFSNCLNVLL